MAAKIVIGVILVIFGFFYLYLTKRLWPPGTHLAQMARPSTKGQIVTRLIVVAVALVIGIALICQGSWWWLVAGAVSGLIWAIFSQGAERK